MTDPVTHTRSYPTYIITQEPRQVPRRKGPFYGKKMVEDFLREAYRYNPEIICIVIDVESEDNTWYPESGYEWLDINGDGRKRHPRKDRPSTPSPLNLVAGILTVDMNAPLTAVDRLRALAGGSRDIAFEPSDADEILEKLEALAALLSAPNLEIGDETATVQDVEVTDEMVSAARSAYSKSTGCNDTPHVLDGWIEDALRAAIEAALAKMEDQP